MEANEAMKADLIERLRAMYDHRCDGMPTQHVNPDGPEAADELSALRSQVSELRADLEALKNEMKGHDLIPEGKHAALLAENAALVKGAVQHMDDIDTLLNTIRKDAL